MSNILDDNFQAELARRLKQERERQGWSLNDLAERSGVSRAMVYRIENAQSSPTAALLGKLSAALGVTMSALLAPRRKYRQTRHSPFDEQAVWTDPETGYVRRQVTPEGSEIEIVEIDLPAGARVSFPAESYRSISQVIWVNDGELTFHEGDRVHRLRTGDSLILGVPNDCEFRNPSAQMSRYTVALRAR